MRLSVPIPQEIIDSIINELHANITALKACTLVSHSFHITSRKHIFSSIQLQKSSVLRKLLGILRSQPDIAFLVRKLSIAYEERAATTWFAEDKLLPPLLNMLHHLEILTLDFLHDAPSVALSMELRLALIERICAPDLTELHIYGSARLPVSLIRHFTHLRQLCISFPDVDTEVDEQLPKSSFPIVLHLDTLHIPYLRPGLEPPSMRVFDFVTIATLKHLDIDLTTTQTLRVVQEVIRSSATSIRSVHCHYLAYVRGSFFTISCCESLS